MPSLSEYASHSAFSDPGPHAKLLEAIDPDVAKIAEVARNVLVHYGSPEYYLAPSRRHEIDSRWMTKILDTDQSRTLDSLDAPRHTADKVAVCCRDFALMTVATLRQHGVPARSRVGFADYFIPGMHVDHVVVEWWNGTRWVRTDPQLDPTEFAFDTLDMPTGPDSPFQTASEAWTSIRGESADAATYGVFPSGETRGAWYVRDFVLRELAHRERDELLLWDEWGFAESGAQELDAKTTSLTDELASLLIAADDLTSPIGAATNAALSALYASDDRLNPRGWVVQKSPIGLPDVEVELDPAKPRAAA